MRGKYMIRKHIVSIAFAVSTVIIACLAIAPVPLFAKSKQVKSNNYNSLAATFVKRVEEYVKLRESIEEQLPKLSKDSTPEQIQAHQTTFQEKVRAARSSAKVGDIFIPDMARYIRSMIKNNFKGEALKELRETAMEVDLKDVPLKINYPYPDTKELTQMPPTLLLKLPTLPKQVKYRFVERHLLLVDRENNLIIDYMLNALP
jgi:hypothetical protein